MTPAGKTDLSWAEQKSPKEQAQMTKAPADKHIWAIYITLCLISIVELYSASSREVTATNIYGPILRHCAMLFGGFLIILFLQNVPYRRFIKWIPVFVLLSIVMAVYVNFFGLIINGARRSFSIMGIVIQSAEFIKLSAVLSIAFILSRSQSNHGVKNSGIVWSAAIAILFGALLIKQGLTNTLLLMLISISMMLIGGVQIKKVVAICIVYLAIAAFAYFVHNKSSNDAEAEKTEALAENPAAISATGKGGEIDRSALRMERLKVFFTDSAKYKHPITAKNLQEQYSYIAQANGGIIGVGPGNSRETARLPLAFTDYIYAIVIEDLGLVGGLVVLVLYLWLIVRAGSIASACSRAFPALLVIGMAIFIVLQALFHMAIVTGVFPVSGQPLPLISKGGSSILITSIAFGIMLSVSRYAARAGKKQDIKEEINALPESMRGENLTQL